MKLCSVEGCTRKFWARGYCNSHYNSRIYHNTPKGRADKRKNQRIYQKSTLGKLNEAKNKKLRRQRLIQATPPWTTWTEMQWLLLFAKEMGLVLDHVIPIANSIVCGLNCPDNINFITKEQNLRKGNKFYGK